MRRCTATFSSLFVAAATIAVAAPARAQQAPPASSPAPSSAKEAASPAASAVGGPQATAAVGGPQADADVMGGGDQETHEAPLPAPDTTVSPINRPLMVSGLVLFGGTYAASVIDAALSFRPSDQNNLYTPVVGPWLDLANRGCDQRPCGGETGNKTLLILDGIGQGLGALAVVTSFFLPEKSTRHWYLIGDERFHAAPTPVGTGYGVLGAGTF